MRQKIAKTKQKIIVGSILIVIVLAIVAGGYLFMNYGGNKKPDQKVFAESTLREVLEISELSTISYTYNGIVGAYEELGTLESGTVYGESQYYVSYKGTVKAGIDFDKIDIKINEEQKQIKVKLPKAEIQDAIVDEGSLEYLHRKSQSDSKGNNFKKAFQLCTQDLQNKTKEDKSLLKLAQENAKSTVKALLEPWIEQMEEGYSIVVE